MKAYLIDTPNRSITEVEYSGDYKHIYELIECSTFDCVRFDKGDAVFVDDNGLINGPVYNFFGFKGYPNPLAGKGLILGSDEEGETTAPSYPMSWYGDRLVWCELCFRNTWVVSHRGKDQVMSIDQMMDWLSKAID